MSWWDSLFSSGSSSAADAAMGGTVDMGSSGGFDVSQPSYDYAGGAVPDFDYSPDAPQFDPSSFDSGQGSDWSGSMGFGGADTGSPVFQPSSVGPPPAGGPSFEMTPVGMPAQGTSGIGGFGAGAEDLTGGAVDDAPATAWESKAGPWYGKPADSSRADVLRSGDGLAYSSTPGTVGRVNPAASVASSSPAAPSFMDKLGAWGRQTGTSLANAPGEAADTFARAPIATTAKLAGVLGPLVLGGINASQQADQARQAERQYRRTMPGPVGVAPLPGTSGTGQADLPAGSPMSRLLTNPAGGFSVDPNVGLRSPQRLAEGGMVGQPAPIGSGPVGADVDYGIGLRAGGPVGQPAPSLNDSARVVMDYLARMLQRSGR